VAVILSLCYATQIIKLGQKAKATGTYSRTNGTFVPVFTQLNYAL